MPTRETLLIAAEILLAIGSALVLYGVWSVDTAPEGFVKEGRRWKR